MNEETSTVATGRPGCIFCELGTEISRLLGGAYPEESRQHFRNSRIEFLKGLRGFLDARIERLSRQEQHGTHVVVE